MWFRENAIYFKNHTNHVNKFFGDNTELLNIEIGGKYSYSWALKYYC